MHKRALYKTAKLFHIAGLVLWLGPGTGGYILFLFARYKHMAASELLILRGYIRLVDIEAASLLILIISGAVMRSSAPALKEAVWLKWKLLVVFFIFLPLEAANLYICHSLIANALETAGGVEEAILLYDRFSILAGILLGVGVPVVFWLAIFKPGPAR